MPPADSPRAELTGTGIGRRAVVGPVVRMAAPPAEPSAQPSGEAPEVELDRARHALRGVAEALRARGGEGREVLEAQAMMALDPALDDALAAATRSGVSGARAIYDAFAIFRAALTAAGGYVAGRVADLDDVRNRAVAACLGVPMPEPPAPGHPYVLVADDLSPADTAVLDLSTVLAVVTAGGGPTSHTAVLARARGIPAVVGCAGAASLVDGDAVLVDPARDRVVVHPDADESPLDLPRPRAFAGPGRTADGHPIALLANIGGPDDLAAALKAGAEGIGLYRTELLFLDRATAPSRDDQEAAYAAVFRAFPGRRVVVRVLDAGADKPLAFVPHDPEPNPALGMRGLRALRRHPELLRTQLSAIAAARQGTHAQVWVMAPMVADAREAAWFVERAAAFGLGVAGVMVEVPAAAMLADQILGVAAFASIGTNDLGQYGLAVDRQLAGLGALQDPWHPGLLRLVAEVGRAGWTTGRPVGVCGEAAADPLLARVLVGLGVTSLSMASGALADVRASLAEVTLAACEESARRALGATDAASARAAAEG